MSAVTLRDVQEIFQLRLVLEVTAVRLAAGKVDAGRLRSLNEAAHATWTPGDEASESTYLRANRELHRYVAESSGNQRLAALVVGLMEQHERIVRLGLALQNREHEFHHFHDDLVEALIEGDGDRAARLTEAALRGGQKKVMEALADSADRVLAGEDGPRSLTGMAVRGCLKPLVYQHEYEVEAGLEQPFRPPELPGHAGALRHDHTQAAATRQRRRWRHDALSVVWRRGDRFPST